MVDVARAGPAVIAVALVAQFQYGELSMTGSAGARFYLRSGETWRNPFPMYTALRERDPVHHAVMGDFWILTRFEDVWAAAGDPATFSSSQGLTVAYDELRATGLGTTMPMVFLDPPAHTEFRRLVTGNLTQRKVSTIEPAQRACGAQSVEGARSPGTVDRRASLGRCRASWSRTPSACRLPTVRASSTGPRPPSRRPRLAPPVPTPAPSRT
jgi:hypothetical protein